MPRRWSLVAGCGGGAERVEDVALRRLPVESYAQWPVRTYVVRSQAEWDAVFAEVRSIGNPMLPPPAVDFASDTVLGISVGWWSSPCDKPYIREVTRRGIDYTVEYGSDAMPPGSACAAVVVPGISFVLVPRPVGQVTFVRKDR